MKVYLFLLYDLDTNVREYKIFKTKEHADKFGKYYNVSYLECDLVDTEITPSKPRFLIIYSPQVVGEFKIKKRIDHYSYDKLLNKLIKKIDHNFITVEANDELEALKKALEFGIKNDL